MLDETTLNVELSLVIRCWGQNPNPWFGYAFFHFTLQILIVLHHYNKLLRHTFMLASCLLVLRCLLLN